MTNQETATWLGERRGREFSPEEVRHLSGWVFWHCREYEEVECIKAEPNDMWAEPWSDIKVEESPFGEPFNSQAYATALERLNSGYDKYIKRMEDEWVREVRMLWGVIK